MPIDACSCVGPETRAICSNCATRTPDAKESVGHKSELNPCYNGTDLHHAGSSKLTIPPINSLPIEILMRIFELAHYLWWKTFFKKERADWPAIWDRSIRKQMHSAYPEVLTHVCPLWRQIILSSSALWSYIDLFTLGSPPQLPLSRSSIFVSRARNHPLILCIRLRHGFHEPVSECAGMSAFCSSIGPRLNALRIDNTTPSESTTLFTSLIQATLPHTTPGILVQLDIEDHSARTISNYGENIDGLTGWAFPTAEGLGISELLLDNITGPIRALKLNGRFFPWRSPAYCGLIELHLLCTRPQYGHRPSVQVVQLREILLACPELRILHINININERNTHLALSPVPLHDLEELNLRGLKRSLYDLLLPLLNPGQKPLRLTFQTPRDEPTVLYCPTLLEFFRRANVAHLFIMNRHTNNQPLPLDVLLLKSPQRLHTLGLERFKINGLELSQFERVLPPMKLNHLCLRKCLIDAGPGVLEKLAYFFPAQLLKLHQIEFEDVSDGAESLAREEINRAFPTVKWVRSTRGMELWSAWEVEYFDPH